MKRALLLLISVSACFTSWAQNDRIHIHLEYQGDQDSLHYSVDYYPSPHRPAELTLALKHLKPDSLKLVQGRPKESLTFERSEGTVSWQKPSSWLPGSAYRFYFSVALSRWTDLPYFKKLSPGFVVNALNMSQGGTALAGFFYPAPPSGQHHMEMDLCLPKALNYSTPLRVAFQVEGERQTCYYLSAEDPQRATDFYLLIGVFEDDDPEDLDAALALSEGAEEALALQGLREQHGDFLDSLSKASDRIFLDEDLLVWRRNQSQSALAEAALLKSKDLPPQEGQELEFKERAAFAILGETDSAARFIYHYYRDRLGTDWLAGVLKEKIAGADHFDFFWSEWLSLQARQGGLTDPLPNLSIPVQLTARPQSKRSALLALYRAYGQKKDSLSVEVNYRYNRERGGLQLYLSRTDSLPTFSFPLELALIASQESGHDTLLLFPWLGQKDTLTIPLSGPPRSAYLIRQSPYPLKVEEVRPLNYWLYDLAQGQPQRKQRAVRYLLKHANRQLLTTVIGIALRGPSAQQQLKALENFARLREVDQERFATELEQIANSGSTEALRRRAREIIERRSAE